MELLVERGDFPLTESWSYLNAANVALIPMGAAKVITDWQTDLALSMVASTSMIMPRIRRLTGCVFKRPVYLIVVLKILLVVQVVLNCWVQSPGQ